MSPRTCAPARAADLAGLPATFLQVGAFNLFVDENIEYARRLLRAGVPTELRVYPGAFHGFDIAAEIGLGNAIAVLLSERTRVRELIGG